jgi:glycerol-3-phosphate dehydrogenase (NAD(P)+)
MKVSILGAGQMGAAFGAPLIERGHEPCFWGPEWLDGPRLEDLSLGRPHPELGVPLSAPARTASSIEDAIRGADLVVLAVVSEVAEWVCGEALERAPQETPIMVLTKGLVERESGSIVPVAVRLREMAGPRHAIVGIGGPVKAVDLIQGYLTQTAFACEDLELARELSGEISTSYYFPQPTDDLLGLGLCAALKNCYAIAFGYLTGDDVKPNLRALAFGTALGELSTIVTAAGGRPETAAGAAGAGDLYVTCLSGRNGDFGALLNSGGSSEAALAEMNNATVEGLGTMPYALGLARSLGLGKERLPLLHRLQEVIENPRPATDSALAELLAEPEASAERGGA